VSEPPAGRWWGRHLHELRWQAEAARLAADPVFYGVGVPRGDGRPVLLLLPGFLAADYTLMPMAGWLARIGYRPSVAGFLANVGCSERAAERAARRLRALHDRHGRRVAVIGHSRGGHYARVLTAATADALAADGGIDRFRELTGLPISPYSSALKLRWLLDQEPTRRAAAERGDLLFGTPDTWLLWNLTGGPDGGVHATDPTNASRTLLMDLRTLDWDDGLLDAMAIPRALLPEIRSSSEGYGLAAGELSGVPVAGILGDQPASLFGHTCFDHGDVKNTYGTGAFLLFTLGTEPVISEHGLITTVAWKLGDADAVYALEGSVAMAGALVQWLRDNLGLIDDAPEVEQLARSVDDSGGVVFVPAFSGLFAPYWRDDARGVIVGLTRFANKGHIARAALEATAYQTRDLVARRHRAGAPRRAASRRRHDQERAADAVPGRHPRLPGGRAGHRRDHRHGRRVRRRAGDGRLVRARRAACQLRHLAALGTRDGRRHAHRRTGGLAPRSRPNPRAGRTAARRCRCRVTAENPVCRLASRRGRRGRGRRQASARRSARSGSR